jgi:DNA polymerase-3 subunit delta'
MPDTKLLQTSVQLFSQQHVLPWQQVLWQKLLLRQTDKFPHALLFCGLRGMGKKAFSFYLSKTLLCQSPGEKDEPCHQCKSCRLFETGNHPDFKWLTIVEDKKIIPVDRVREVIDWSLLSSQFDGKKILLIEPAEAMNINAANSLLKTLEEPVANTLIFLLTDRKQALLPTIRSRCQTYVMQLTDRQIAIDWLVRQGVNRPELMLSLASGAPLKALEMSSADSMQTREMIIEQLLSVHTESKDPVKVAESLVNLAKKTQPGAGEILYWFDSILIDLARIQHNCEPMFTTNNDLYDRLKQISDRLYLKNIMQLTDLINKAYYDIQGQINIHLLLESLLIRWQQCKR